MGCSKSRSSREVYSNTILPQKTRKISNKQPNLTPKAIRERRTKRKNPKISRRKEIIKIRSEINEKEITETIAKINKTKSWFFDKKTKLINHFRLITKTREKIQINRMRNEKGEVTNDTAEIQRIIKDDYKQLYDNKMDNLEYMDKFLEMYKLQGLNQEEIETMNRSIKSTEIETVITNLPTNKTPEPDGFTGEFYQTYSEELTLILLKLFQNIAREEHSQIHSTRSPSP